ncbi:MAG: 30S ribosomal protein S4 [Candidatus Paceibacterota bacterium]|jgi:small subunit ribosomal protein S4
MKRYKSKTERRYGQNLQIKGERGLSTKASFKRRPFPPGPAGKTKFQKKTSEFGAQLAEKQKLRITYGLRERQFKNIVNKALDAKGQTDVVLMQLLESRLDNVILRMGIADSRAQARQIVVHAHILINGKRNNVPSYMVRKGDIVSLKKRFKESGLMKDIQSRIKNYNPPSWISLEKEKLEAKIINLPEGTSLNVGINLTQVIEYYSR